MSDEKEEKRLMIEPDAAVGEDLRRGDTVDFISDAVGFIGGAAKQEEDTSEEQKTGEAIPDKYAIDPWAEAAIPLVDPIPVEDTAEEQDEYLARFVQPANPPMVNPRKKSRLLEKVSMVIVAAILFGGIAGGVFVGIQALSNRFGANGGQARLEEQEKDDAQRRPLEGYHISNTDTVVNEKHNEVSAVDVSAIVESVMPAVVAISCYETNNNPFWGSSDGKLEPSGSGSGIIIGQNETEVLIVTNNHVINGAEKITIELVDGSSVDATVKGTEPSSDLAVVAIPFSGLQESTAKSIRIARLGNSDDVKIGQMAIAIGNALGYGQSVTVGYISAKERQVQVENVIYTLIQTDAAINPGNSGGALLNANGEVIGINSVKYSNNSVEGMGFAIPISNIMDLITELSNREVLPEEEHGFLGIYRSKDISSEYAKLLGISQGVYVNRVEKGSPAEKGGMYAGDIITQIDNTIVTCQADLENFLSYTKAGTTVTVKIQRMEDGAYKEVSLKITLGSRPDNLK